MLLVREGLLRVEFFFSRKDAKARRGCKCLPFVIHRLRLNELWGHLGAHPIVINLPGTSLMFRFRLFASAWLRGADDPLRYLANVSILLL